MKLTKSKLKQIIKEELEAAMLTLEMFDTGSAGDAVGGMTVVQQKARCKKAGGEWIGEDPTGRYGHCSKPVTENLTPDEKDEKKELEKKLDKLQHK
jgi:hypothetical protein